MKQKLIYTALLLVLPLLAFGQYPAPPSDVASYYSYTKKNTVYNKISSVDQIADLSTREVLDLRRTHETRKHESFLTNNNEWVRFITLLETEGKYKPGQPHLEVSIFDEHGRKGYDDRGDQRVDAPYSHKGQELYHNGLQQILTNGIVNSRPFPFLTPELISHFITEGFELDNLPDGTVSVSDGETDILINEQDLTVQIHGFNEEGNPMLNNQTFTVLTNGSIVQTQESIQESINLSNGSCIQKFDITQWYNFAVQDNTVGKNGENSLTFKDDLAVYPNPFSDRIFIDIDDVKNIQDISILDLGGRTVRQIQAYSMNSRGIELEDLPVGTYLIQITTTADIITKKIIKN